MGRFTVVVVVVAKVGVVTFTPVVVEVVEVVANVGVVMFTPEVVVVVESVAIVTMAPGLDFFEEVPRTRKATTTATATIATTMATAFERCARFSNPEGVASLMRFPCSFNQKDTIIAHFEGAKSQQEWFCLFASSLTFHEFS